MPNKANVSTYLVPLRALVEEAGRKILEIYHQDFEVAHKSDGSPVTAADHAAQEVILAGLKKLTPNVPILSEESRSVDFSERTRWPRFWLVDPLDGTREFADKESGEFTVNIALIENTRPILGVVYVPVMDRCYFACQSGGAFKQLPGAEPLPIHVRPYPEESNRLMVAGSRSHAGKHLAAFLARIGEHDLVSLGSSLKFCLVAEGAIDLYPRLGRTMEWDTAAAQCVVEEAGGVVLGPDRQPLSYNKPSLENPWFIVSAGDYDWAQYLPSVTDGQ